MSEGSIVRSILFNTFTNDLDAAECTFSKFEGDRKFGGVVDTLNSDAVIQRDLERLEKGADKNIMKLSKEKCKTPRLGFAGGRQTGKQLCRGGLGGPG